MSNARFNVARAVARALVMGSVGAVTIPALAQEPVLEEITVTAERRETALQNTPISIIALTSDTMEQKGIEDLADIGLFTPNLSIQGSRGTGNNQPSFLIRGISGGGGATSERGVALYIDGIYVPRTNGSVFKVFDLERVEVLRGPQGTLFGRNSTGGAIRLVTKQPGSEFESYVKATVGNFDRVDISGMVNIPISDTVALRAQAAYLTEDGYIERGTQTLGGSEDVLGRLQLAITPNDNLKMTFGALYSDSKSDGSPSDIESFDLSPNLNYQGNYADWISDAFQLVGQPRLAVVDDPRFVLDDYTMPGYCFVDDFNPDWDEACAQRNNNEYYQVDANIQWTISDTMKFTSLTGFAEMDHVGNTDWQQLGFEFRPDDVNSEVFYQEFQLDMALFGGRVDFITGLTYFHEKSGAATYQLTRRGTSVFTAAGGAANGNADAGLFRTNDTDTTQKSESIGWFNSATWHITDRFNFTGGLRFAYDAKDYEQTRFAASDFVPAPGTTSTTVTADDSWNDVDWRATLDYHFTEDFMAYATVSKAYRAGAYSFTVLANVPGPAQSGDFITPIPPEEVLSYELGLRTTFFGGRLRVNPTGYFMQWSNRQGARQVSCVTEGLAACPVGFRIQLVDSGDVDVYGFEFDTQLAVTDNLTLDGALGITNYDVKDPVANTGPNLFPAQPSPSWNIGATYRLPTTSWGTFGLNLNYAYIGEQETHPTSGTDSAYLLPSYDTVNAQLTWVTSSGKNQVTLFANNALDDTYATYATRFGGGFWDNGPGTGVGAPPRSMLSVVRSRPIEYGLTVKHTF